MLLNYRSRLSALLLGLGLTTGAMLAGRPDAVHAEQLQLRRCTDAAWAGYNECLMSSSSYWSQVGCDYAFGVEYEACHINFWKSTLLM